MSRRTVHSSLVFGMLSLVLTWASPVAQADLLSVTESVGGAPSATGVSYVNFDGLPAGAVGGTPDPTGGVSNGITVSFATDGGAVQGSLVNVYAAPYLSMDNGTLFGDSSDGPDTTTYLTTGLGSVTLSFGTAQQYFGLLWGSVDSYNTLSFYDAQNHLIGAVTGSQVTSSADGDQGVNGTYYVNINSTVAFTTVVATSTQYAFEFDNVAYSSAEVATDIVTPEPSTFVTAAVGALGMIAFCRRRRRKGIVPAR